MVTISWTFSTGSNWFDLKVFLRGATFNLRNALPHVIYWLMLLQHLFIITRVVLLLHFRPFKTKANNWF